MLLRTELIGRIGKDATLSFTDNGSQVINFPVCYSKKYTRNDNTQGETVVWLECSYWRGAEQSARITESIRKGDLIFLEGMPIADFFTDNQGNTKPVLKLKVDKIVLLSNRQG